MARRRDEKFAASALLSSEWKVDDAAREEAQDLFGAVDQVTAGQFLAQPEQQSPEKTLALAVFCQALQDCQRPRIGLDSDTREQVHAEAMEWLASDSTANLYDFRSIADLFGWDPDKLRAGILGRLGELKLPGMRDIMPQPAKALRAKKASPATKPARPPAMRESHWQRLTDFFGVDAEAYRAEWRRQPAQAFFEFLADQRELGTLVKKAKAA